MSVSVSRRLILQRAAAAAAAVSAGIVSADNKGKSKPGSGGYALSGGKRAGEKKGVEIFGYQPFTQKCPVPPVLRPRAVGQDPYRVGSVYHGVAPEYRDRRCAEAPETNWYEKFQPAYYELRAKKCVNEYLPGVKTPVYGYGGSVPGPTIRTVVGQPCVLRLWNDIDLEMACHFHGLHLPSHASGGPTQYVLPGRARDYFLPCTVPLLGGRPDYSESPSTSWYHDRALGVSGANNYYGLSGFCLSMDETEYDLVQRNVLPAARYDIPLCLQDRCLNKDGLLNYKAQQDEGNLGDLYVVNGKVQPVLSVQRRKYRFRLLNACNTRYLSLKLHNGMKLIRLGKDSWLYNNAVEEGCVVLCPGERADVVIDFSDCEQEIYLCNSLTYSYGCRPTGNPRCGNGYGGDHDGSDYDRDDKHGYGVGYGMGSRDSYGYAHESKDYNRGYSYGSGRDGRDYDRDGKRGYGVGYGMDSKDRYGYADKSKGYRPDEEKCDDDRYGRGCIPWLKFVVEGSKQKDCATVKHGDCLRPHRILKPTDCETTRYFDIESAGGGYQVNRRQYDAKSCVESPKVGSVERWVYRNKTADACPIHIPGGSYQIHRVNGKAPYRTDACKSDVATVYGGEELEILKHFRTFAGSWTAHCSSVDYDYRRGMHNYEPKTGGSGYGYGNGYGYDG
jgi:FtsP/CotA-like multicopper oxidase with cupredoxin domain